MKTLLLFMMAFVVAFVGDVSQSETLLDKPDLVYDISADSVNYDSFVIVSPAAKPSAVCVDEHLRYPSPSLYNSRVGDAPFVESKYLKRIRNTI